MSPDVEKGGRATAAFRSSLPANEASGRKLESARRPGEDFGEILHLVRRGRQLLGLGGELLGRGADRLGRG